jgi:hypothetical protein
VVYARFGLLRHRKSKGYSRSVKIQTKPHQRKHYFSTFGNPFYAIHLVLNLQKKKFTNCNKLMSTDHDSILTKIDFRNHSYRPFELKRQHLISWSCWCLVILGQSNRSKWQIRTTRTYFLVPVRKIKDLKYGSDGNDGTCYKSTVRQYSYCSFQHSEILHCSLEISLQPSSWHLACRI